jgi:hypothetical protein
MPDKHSYEYAVIRLVPRVEREEFLNIGVILYCKRLKYLGMRYHLDPQRISLFGCAFDLAELARYLQGWEWICQGTPQGGHIAALDLSGRFHWLTATRSTIIQSGTTHTGLTQAPDQTLSRLLQQYVT